MNGRPKQAFLQSTDGHKKQEKMLNITNYYRNVNQNYNEDITSHWSEWPSSQNLQTINAGEDAEKREFSYTVGRNVNWYSHPGKQYGGFLWN